jgi:hypothetical protein
VQYALEENFGLTDEIAENPVHFAPIVEADSSPRKWIGPWKENELSRRDRKNLHSET